jgi:hypothetical protein
MAQTPEEILFENVRDLGYDIYPMQAPQNKKVPFLTYIVTADTIGTNLDSSNTVGKRFETRFMLNIYTDTFEELKRMQKYVLENLKNINNGTTSVVIYGSSDTVENDFYRCKIDIKIYLKI